MKLTFDEETHQYKIGNQKIPSVTQIIEELLPRQYKPNDWYLKRGSAVHACAAMIARGIEFKYNEGIEGQVRAIRKFFKEIKPEVQVIEGMVYSIQYQFGGTFDLLAKINNRYCLIDYKPSISIEHIGLQLGGYAVAHLSKNLLSWGIGVAIKENGEYSMTEPINLKNYAREFLALRAVYGIRERLNLNQGGKS